MRRALTDDLLWRVLVSDEEGREQAAGWLRDSVERVRADRKIRHARSVAARANYPAHTRGWHQAYAEFAEWDARARRFERLVVQRMKALGLNDQGHRVIKPDALEKARAHAESCFKQMRHAVRSLADLASLVEGHVAGSISLEELDQALDDLTVAHNGDETQSLRDLLAGIRAAAEGRAS